MARTSNNKHSIGAKAFIAAALIALSMSSAPKVKAAVPEESAAVVFVYQRIGEENAPAGSNLSFELFQEHIKFLKREGYAVRPLGQIIEDLKNKRPLPDKTVALTFDGAYRQTMEKVIPVLETSGFPFTVFVSSDLVDEGKSTHYDWNDIKKLQKNKDVEIGAMPSAYVHMASLTEEQILLMINKSVSKFRENLGEAPVLFSYPHGEKNKNINKNIQKYGFKAFFGLHNGVLHEEADFSFLPRFLMTEEYGDLERLALTANALPLPVSDVLPEDMILEKNPPMVGFTVASDIKDIPKKLSCFGAGIGKLPLLFLPENRVEIRPEAPFAERRTRINCTLPHTDKRWRWFGMIIVAPDIEETSLTIPSSDDLSDDIGSVESP